MERCDPGPSICTYQYPYNTYGCRSSHSAWMTRLFPARSTMPRSKASPYRSWWRRTSPRWLNRQPRHGRFADPTFGSRHPQERGREAPQTASDAQVPVRWPQVDIDVVLDVPLDRQLDAEASGAIWASVETGCSERLQLAVAYSSVSSLGFRGSCLASNWGGNPRSSNSSCLSWFWSQIRIPDQPHLTSNWFGRNPG